MIVGVHRNFVASTGVSPSPMRWMTAGKSEGDSVGTANLALVIQKHVPPIHLYITK